MKLLGLFLIRCVVTKKILGGQKLVKTGTGKNRGFPEHYVQCCGFGSCGLLPDLKKRMIQGLGVFAAVSNTIFSSKLYKGNAVFDK